MTRTQVCRQIRWLSEDEVDKIIAEVRWEGHHLTDKQIEILFAKAKPRKKYVEHWIQRIIDAK